MGVPTEVAMSRKSERLFGLLDESTRVPRIYVPSADRWMRATEWEQLGWSWFRLDPSA